MPGVPRVELAASLRYALLGAVLAVWYLTPLPLLVSTVVVATMPIEEDVVIAKAYVRSEGLDYKVVRSQVLDTAVRQIAGRVLEALPRHERAMYPWQFSVLDDPSVNAFALPGGFIYLNLGLLRSASSPEEVAGVIAHEIGHVLSRHSQKRLVEENLLSTLVQALVHEDGSDAPKSFGQKLVEALARGASQLGGLKFSRANEFEADARGSALLRDSGVGIEGMVRFFESLLRLEERAHEGSREATPQVLANVQGWLSTHPATAERIVSLRSQIDELSASERGRAWSGSGSLSREVDWAAVRRELGGSR